MLTLMDQLRVRVHTARLGADPDQYGFWPLLLKPLLNLKRPQEQQGPVPPQADYPPPRRPLPAPPAPLLAEVVQLLKNQQEMEKKVDTEEFGLGADGIVRKISMAALALVSSPSQGWPVSRLPERRRPADGLKSR
jgi:hypothetical protein